ncbi:hypothetical protein DY000_02009809 [Brassica cretica]|uniref:Uncharacterized protein n=1 Tax=Brassica cretica TaxID=69181 RepID=A0ABQ7BW73_BRACR|nr:hypothetical protein DY000_02009809 [Brassica cretica]
MLAGDWLIQTGQRQGLSSYWLPKGSHESAHISVLIHGPLLAFSSHLMTASSGRSRVKYNRCSHVPSVPMVDPTDSKWCLSMSKSLLDLTLTLHTSFGYFWTLLNTPKALIDNLQSGEKTNKGEKEKEKEYFRGEGSTKNKEEINGNQEDSLVTNWKMVSPEKVGKSPLGHVSEVQISASKFVILNMDDAEEVEEGEIGDENLETK